MKEYDERKCHISSKIRVTYKTSANVRHPVAETFTTFHPTTLHSTHYTHPSSITGTGVGIPFVTTCISVLWPIKSPIICTVRTLFPSARRQKRQSRYNGEAKIKPQTTFLAFFTLSRNCIWHLNKLPSDYWERQLKNYDIKCHNTVNVRHVFDTFKVDGGNGFPRNVDVYQTIGRYIPEDSKHPTFPLFSQWTDTEFSLFLKRIYDRILLKLPQRKGWLVQNCPQNVAIIGMQDCIFEGMCSMVKEKKSMTVVP